MILTPFHEVQFEEDVMKEIEFGKNLCQERQLVPVTKAISIGVTNKEYITHYVSKINIRTEQVSYS